MRRRSVLALAVMACTAALCITFAYHRLTPPDTVSSLPWAEDWEEFGGWSGLDLSADGSRFVALSDGSTLASGQLTRTNGKLAAIRATRHGYLAPLDPAAPENRIIRDAEGLAVDHNGRVWASFERITRILPFTATGHPLGRAPDIPKSLRNSTNSGLEALAITANGALLAIPERSGSLSTPFPVYRYAFGAWDIATTLPRDRGWLMVGADIGPDGWLYTLERRFFWGAFASRVRRFSLTDPAQASTLYTSPPGRHGNLEGLAVWQTDTQLHLTMITDDNLNWFQRNELVEVTLPLP